MTTTKRKPLPHIRDDTDYYEHQIDGVRRGAKMTSFLLADEMGLGKSLQAATVAAIDFKRGAADRVLVVCPSFLKWNWAEELDARTNFTWTVPDGTPQQRKRTYNEFNTDFLIVGYEQLVNDYDMIAAMNFQIVIVDEAHYIKNNKSKRSKAVIKFATTQVDRVFLLTGSPMLNRPNELWSLLHVIDPKRFPKYWPFVNRFCVYGGWQSKQIVGAKNKRELNEILQEYMIRRLKKDVLDLPEKQIIRQYVALHPNQKKAYDQIENEIGLVIPGDPTPMQTENILTKYLRLKQITGTPAAIGLPDDSYKLDQAVDMCEEFTTDPDDPTPVVVFTQFTGVREAMARRLIDRGIPVWQLSGETPQAKRIPLINEWSASDPPGVLIIMLQMAVGLNLTAAKKGIFLDRLYVPKLNEQAEDRLHRIGTDLSHPVQLYVLIAKGTVEEKIEKILTRKSKLFNALVENDSDWKKELIKQLAEEQA